jgi:hypothetical protein
VNEIESTRPSRRRLRIRALGVADDQVSAAQRGDLEATCLDTDAQILLRFTSEVLQDAREAGDLHRPQ